MEKKTVGLIAAMLVVGFFIGAIGEYGAVSNQITDLQRQVSTLQTQVSSLQSQISSLQSELLQRDAEIISLQGQVAQKDAEILNLQEQVNELVTDLNNRDAVILSLQAQIETLQSQVHTRILGVYFSPDGGCEDQVLYWIGRANSTIHILIYSFTLDLIGDALVEAYQRGIEVRVVFEEQQVTQYSEYWKLKAAGVPVRNDTNPDYMHHKVMIIDGVIVLTGSFNYSAHAEEENNENLIVISSLEVAEIYEEEFERIWEASV